MKKGFNIFSLVLLIVVLAIGTAAASPEKSIPSMSLSDSSSNTNSTIEFVPSQTSSTLFSNWTNNIRKIGTGTVEVICDTSSVTNVDTIGIKESLQKNTGSSWVTIANWSKTASNSNYVSDLHTYNVVRGNQYRFYTTHTAKKGAITENHSLYSHTITVD